MSAAKTVLDSSEAWPGLPLSAWAETYATLHMWTQIVGKIRLAMSPHMNHWWECPLYVNARGLTTSPIPYAKGAFEIQFDFIDHKLDVTSSSGETKSMRLQPCTVADFHTEIFVLLKSLGIEAKIWNMPVEIPNPIRFDQDRIHNAYDPQAVNAFYRILVNVDCIFKEFRSRFLGKVSPVHFFWGSFDLAVTRFSGRRAPDRPAADKITRDAYSHEVSSVGFWPGGGDINGAAFYSYAAPQPEGFGERPVRPTAAYYHKQMGEFLLMYDDVRASDSPRSALLDFCQSTYDAAAVLGNWDRANLEKPVVK
ncbi:MAG TPA: DUF5996 family protein [Candidatus Acidoferrales bacterium]|jgi:hypothetical protein|nr:DUF5996 family protein [Candidatus Acidoferrales bacterium]